MNCERASYRKVLIMARIHFENEIPLPLTLQTKLIEQGFIISELEEKYSK